MVHLYGRQYSRQELLARIGDISQIGGVKGLRLAEGNEEGTFAIQVRTGTGFRFVVLAGRGMDISEAEFAGQSLCWRSQTGDVGSGHYEPRGTGWLRSFFGGLLITCGLTTAGAPSQDAGEELPLHGRISHIPAKNLAYDGEWQEDDYVMWVQGKLRETAVFGPDLLLTRRITARLGESRLWITDRVENLGVEPTPHMILYHINGGFPALDEGSELLLRARKTEPWKPESAPGLARYDRFSGPVPGFAEQVFYHQVQSDPDGFARVALINRKVGGGRGFGFYVAYRPDQLPVLVQWKMTAPRTYACGIEPANCRVEGRRSERERGRLTFLQPGEVREYNLEIVVLSSLLAIEAFERRD